MDLTKYDNSKEDIKKWFQRQGTTDIVDSYSLISICTGIPVIVCAFWIGELTNWPPEVLKNIEVIIRSYDYKNIKGIPDSYPRERK